MLDIELVFSQHGLDNITGLLYTSNTPHNVISVYNVYNIIKARCAWKGRSTGCYLEVISFSEASGM